MIKKIKDFIFRGKNKEIELLNKRIEEKNIEIINIVSESNNKSKLIVKLQEELSETNKTASESISKVLMENTKLKDKLEQKEKLRRKNAGAIGGLKAKNNELIAENTELAFQITELKKEFEEYKKNKYIIKELKPQKVPKKRQVMGIKSGTKTSEIIKKIKEEV